MSKTFNDKTHLLGVCENNIETESAFLQGKSIFHSHLMPNETLKNTCFYDFFMIFYDSLVWQKNAL